MDLHGIPSIPSTGYIFFNDAVIKSIVPWLLYCVFAKKYMNHFVILTYQRGIILLCIICKKILPITQCEGFFYRSITGELHQVCCMMLDVNENFLDKIIVYFIFHINMSAKLFFVPSVHLECQAWLLANQRKTLIISSVFSVLFT